MAEPDQYCVKYIDGVGYKTIDVDPAEQKLLAKSAVQYSNLEKTNFNTIPYRGFGVVGEDATQDYCAENTFRQGPELPSSIPDGKLLSQDLGKLFYCENKIAIWEHDTTAATFELHSAPMDHDQFATKVAIAGSVIGVCLPINPIMRGQLERIGGYLRIGRKKWRPALFNVCQRVGGSGITVELDNCPWCGSPGITPIFSNCMCDCNPMRRIEGFGRLTRRPIALAGCLVGSIDDVIPHSRRSRVYGAPAPGRLRMLSREDRAQLAWFREFGGHGAGDNVWALMWPIQSSTVTAVIWENFDNGYVAHINRDCPELKVFDHLLDMGVIRCYLASWPMGNGTPRYVAWIPEFAMCAFAFDIDESLAAERAKYGVWWRWLSAQSEMVIALTRLLLCRGGRKAIDAMNAYLIGIGHNFSFTKRVPSLRELCLELFTVESYRSIEDAGLELLPVRDEADVYPDVTLWGMMGDVDSDREDGELDQPN